ncbi:response regulator [Spirochaeta africana]|uniref:Response regulator with CheY-like receiver domain and winged-helix DNA-binding domain n=1 Tax=Spirochaeta africana (strain ATCC 700263 / DSM 8902 / Z-7692) TaxID=889378 RepID=H9UGX5_SPIAZ|nr:response regulator [Spirochaeta africana]AFG36768.1 response regulator with CheY-like receiver domain and winged-helix DNA-binding domain [Spirochaeta africana DSM 8902]
MARTDKKIRIFSALEVANICGVVNQTAINWIKNGYLRAFQTPGGQYRVYAEDLIDFLQTRNMRMPEELQRIMQEQMSFDSIMVVDDDETLLNSMMEFLREEYPKYELYAAADGFQAGRIISEHKPKVIFLDIDLPGENGYNVCRAIRSDDSLGVPIIIAMSGLDDPELRARIDEAGADTFVKKPLEFDEIPELIKDQVKERRRARRQRDVQ